MNKLIWLEAGPVTGWSTQQGQARKGPELEEARIIAEIGELTEVPQPSPPHDVLSGALFGCRTPTAWMKTGVWPGRSLLCKVASVPSLG